MLTPFLFNSVTFHSVYDKRHFTLIAGTEMVYLAACLPLPVGANFQRRWKKSPPACSGIHRLILLLFVCVPSEDLQAEFCSKPQKLTQARGSACRKLTSATDRNKGMFCTKQNALWKCAAHVQKPNIRKQRYLCCEIHVSSQAITYNKDRP